jgi:hypothetical protein
MKAPFNQAALARGPIGREPFLFGKAVSFLNPRLSGVFARGPLRGTLKQKDACYLYKTYWLKEPFIHLCGSRFVNRNGTHTRVKVYSNQNEVELYANGKFLAHQEGKKVFTFKIKLEPTLLLEARSGSFSDKITIHQVAKKDLSYVSHAGNSYSWEKKKATKIK